MSDEMHPLIKNTDFSGFTLVLKWFSIGAAVMIGFLLLA